MGIRVRFWNWWNNGYCNAFRLDKSGNNSSSVGLGGNISKSIYSMEHGKKPTPRYMASGNDSGNGSLMRLAPIPVFFSHFHGSEDLVQVAMHYAKESNFTTHPGHIAAEACALMSYVIIHAINRKHGQYDKNNGKAKHEENEQDQAQEEESKEDVRAFLESVTSDYLTRIEGEMAKSQARYNEMAQTKEFAALKRKAEQGHGMHGAPSAFQIEVSQLHFQIIAQNYMVRLLKSNESDDSTERCWNWKCAYGDLGIDKTMVNRGSRYNGYPNTQGYFGSYCMDGLAMGLHSLYNSTSFGDAVMKAVNMLGDADSTGSIAGQMAGAWYGFKDVFYDVQGQQFLWRQLAKWSDYEFGVRAVLLSVMGEEAAEQYKAEVAKKKGGQSKQ